MDIKTLNEIESEVKRFIKRLNAARDRIKNERYCSMGCKETGAVRRAALDLKIELNKLSK
jgi:hypothetical protein